MHYSQNESAVRKIAIQTEHSNVFYLWILLIPTNIIVDCHVTNITLCSIRFVQISKNWQIFSIYFN